MANNFKNTSLVTKIAVKEFLNALVMGQKVDRQLDSQFQKVGASIQVRRPVMFEATSGAVLSGTGTDIEERAATVTLDKREKVHFEIDSQAMTLNVEDMTERYIRPAMEELAQKVETDLSGVYTNIGNFTGTPGVTPTTFLTVAQTGAVLSKIGTPMSDRSLFVNADASVALADGLKSVFPESIARKAIEEASVGRYGRFDIFESNSLSSHTVGVASGTPLVNGAAQSVTYAASGDAWTQSLATDGWTNDTADILLAGDVITIAGVNSVNRRTRVDTGSLQTFTVVADAAAGSTTGPATLTISPPMIISGPYQTVTAAPADGAAIVVKTGTAGVSYPQNIGFHKNAITLAMAPLDMPEDGASSARESFKGISIRSTRQYDITNDKTIFRFDILYGIKAQNPDFAVRLTGQYIRGLTAPFLFILLDIIMSTDFKRWIYSETKDPRIINNSEFEKFEVLGWADSPAQFLKLKSVGIDQKKIDDGDEQEAAKAQQVFDTVEGVKESLNGALNLDKMTKQELEDYAKEHFGVDLDRRMKPDKMVKKIRALMES